MRVNPALTSHGASPQDDTGTRSHSLIYSVYVTVIQSPRDAVLQPGQHRSYESAVLYSLGCHPSCATPRMVLRGYCCGKHLPTSQRSIYRVYDSRSCVLSINHNLNNDRYSVTSFASDVMLR